MNDPYDIDGDSDHASLKRTLSSPELNNKLQSLF